MTVYVKTPPVAVMSILEMKSHLKAYGDDTSEDTLLTGYLMAAMDVARLETGRSIGEQTLELRLDSFPASAIHLPYGPVKEVNSVSYTDADGVTQTLADNLYVLDSYGEEPWLVPVVDTPWPAVKAGIVNAMKVEYIAGDFPNAVRSALLVMVAQMSTNRGTLGELPLGVKYLLGTAKLRLGMA